MIRFLIHQWKERIRSPFWQKNVILNIVLGILALYLLANIIMIGFFADKLLQVLFKGGDVMYNFTRFFFYYLIVDLIFRFLFQPLPTISIQPYLTLPIKKSKLLHYPLVRSITGFFNILAVLFFGAFFLKEVYFIQASQFRLVWIAAVFSLLAVNNFLNFLLKKFFFLQPLLTLLLIIIAGSLVYLDITESIPFSRYFSLAMFYLSHSAWLIIIPLALVVLSYFLAYTFLRRNAYIEDAQTDTVIKKNGGFSLLNQYGSIGQLIGIELKLILRNKRPRSLMFISVFILLYGFIFYSNKYLSNDTVLILAGLLLPSVFSLNYGQFIFSWESSYFDSYLANRLSFYSYLRSKYLFLSFAYVVGFALSLPYAFISYKIGFINTALLLYNVGISSMIILFFSTFNSSYIDLGRSQLMNYQGTGITQFLIVIPVIGIPYLIDFIFKSLNAFQYFYYAIAFIGLSGIAFNRYVLQLILIRFTKRKYKMAAGFRKK